MTKSIVFITVLLISVCLVNADEPISTAYSASAIKGKILTVKVFSDGFITVDFYPDAHCYQWADAVELGENTKKLRRLYITKDISTKKEMLALLIAARTLDKEIFCRIDALSGQFHGCNVIRYVGYTKD